MIRHFLKQLGVTVIVSSCLVLLLASCQFDDQGKSVASTKLVVLWAHAGQAGERETLQRQVTQFNSSHDDTQVIITFIPERTYNSQVQAAAVAGVLPDILEIDGPYLANYAWQNQLRELSSLLPKKLLNDLLPSIRQQGTYQNQLYGIGSFDSGLALYARSSLLKNAGIVNIPKHPDQAWSVETFERILEKLSLQDADGAVLDLKLNYPDEWFTYAFSPFLQSAGADLIDRRHLRSAANRLNSDEAISAMRHLQKWLQKKWVDPNLDDNAFNSGRVALSLSGHWEYKRYVNKWKTDLILIPLPDFGKGSKSGQGSWLWSINQTPSM